MRRHVECKSFGVDTPEFLSLAEGEGAGPDGPEMGIMMLRGQALLI